MVKLLALTLTRRSAILIVFEFALIVAAVAASAQLRLGFGEARLLFLVEGGFAKAALIAIICQCCLYFADLYDLQRIIDHRDLFVRIIQGLGATSFLLAALYFWLPSL